MNWLIIKLKEIFFFTIILSILMVIYTILIMINLIPNDNNLNRIILFILGLILFFGIGLISGHKENKNGWLAGLSTAFIILFLSFIVTIFSKNNLDLFLLCKYCCFLICSMVGGILGVNTKVNKKRVN